MESAFQSSSGEAVPTSVIVLAHLQPLYSLHIDWSYCSIINMDRVLWFSFRITKWESVFFPQIQSDRCAVWEREHDSPPPVWITTCTLPSAAFLQLSASCQLRETTTPKLATYTLRMVRYADSNLTAKGGNVNKKLLTFLSPSGELLLHLGFLLGTLWLWRLRLVWSWDVDPRRCLDDLQLDRI